MNKKSATRRLRRQSQHRLKPVYVAVLLAFSVQTAQANPVGGSVVNGSASFATSGNTLTVTNTPGTIINWQGFSIGSNEATIFAQQSASSTVLNRVVGNDPSNILGKLQSNGRVFLINPNGILFGAGAVVDVAGLVASTLNLSNADFLAGKYHFTEVPGAANVSNAGNITAQEGGQIYLIAPNVENTGVITAPNGEILLAAGYSVDLVSTSDPNLRVSITAPAGDATNIGQLIASSGSLGLFGTVVRNSGIVNADSATLQGGKIVFKASQRVEAGGTISAQGAGGGAINLLADMQSGTVNVTGTVDASAPNSGNGGFIETSAAHVQVADTARITTAAAHGKAGTWLIDPTDFTIAATGGDIDGATLSTELGLGNVTILNTDGTINPAGNGDIFVNDAVNWSVNTLTLNAQNNININAVMDATGTAGLDMNTGASGAVNVGMNPDGTFKGMVNLASTTSLTINGNAYNIINSLGVQGDLSPLTLQGMSVGLAGYYVLGSDIDASLTIGWSGGFAPVGNGSTSFTGQFNGLGHTITGLTINLNLPIGYEGLFGVIGAGSTVANVGLVNIALTGGYTRVGALAGANYGTISNSYVSGGTVSGTAVNGFMVGGLVGDNSGSITNSYASGVSVSGKSGYVGGLAGYNGGTISKSYVSGGSVTGSSSVGGLVGSNSGSIDSSYANATNVNGGSQLGGLAGSNYGTIINSNAAASISGSGGSVGGLAGYNGGTISNSYVSSGYIWGSTHVGGLVGQNTGVLTNSHYDIDVVALMDSAGTYVTLGGIYDVQYQDWLTHGLMLNIADYASLTPSGTNSYSISTVQGMKDLLGFADNPAYTFSLAADINLATATGDLGVATGLYIPYLAADFNGNNHTISNLNINQPFNDNLGLFGNIATGSTVNNVILSNAVVTGNSNVGALAGWNQGTISNSHVVDVSTSVSGVNNVGGLAGRNDGTISNSDVSNATVSATGNDVGGLVGYNQANTSYNSSSVLTSIGGTISNSFVSNGTVSGASSVGGLVGYSIHGSINNNSYVSGGTVTGVLTNFGGNNVGGLVGYNNGTIDSSSVYGGVQVKGVNSVGGLVGYNDGAEGGGVITNSSFSDGTVSGNTDVGGLVGYMNYSSTYFGKVGGIISSNSFVSNATVTASGNNAGGLVGYNAGTISGSYVSGGSVTGSGTSSNDIGGLVGYNIGAIDTSSVKAGNVTGVSNVGGLVGQNGGTSTSYQYVGTISKSYVDTGTVVNGGNNVGGLVGLNGGGVSVDGGNPTSSTISNSYVNGGTVSGSSSAVGGLVGYNVGTINKGSYVSGGSVTGGSEVGGLVGYNTGTIDTSFVEAVNVTGGTNVGGLVGLNAGAISNTYASGGTVSGSSSNVGGLVGYNTGTGTISNSYASTGVVGGSNVGGLVGYNAAYGGGVNLTANFWNTSVAGVTVVNGIGNDAGYGGSDINAVGLDAAGMMTMSNFTNAGWDISNTFNSKSIWTIYEGTTMPLLTSFIVPVVIPPVVDVIPNVIDEIVDITIQREKPKPEDLVLAEDVPGIATQPLPVCN